MKSKAVDSATLPATVGGSLLSCRNICGHVADVSTSFTRDEHFLLVPRGRSLMVVRSHSGKIEHVIEKLHQDTVVSVILLQVMDDRVKGDKSKVHEVCASLDASQTVFIWEMTYDLLPDHSASTTSPLPSINFRHRLVTSFNLTDLELSAPRADERVTRVSISGIHFTSGLSQNLESSSLVLVVESRVTVVHHGSDADTSASHSNSRPVSHGYHTLAEVIEIPLPPIMANSGFQPVWLFASGYEARWKSRVKDLATIRSSVTLSGSSFMLSRVHLSCAHSSFDFLLGISLTLHRYSKFSERPSFILVVCHHLIGQYIVVSVNKQLTVFSRPTQTVMTLAHSDVITCVAIDPENRFVATGDATGRLLWWYVTEPYLFTMGASQSANLCSGSCPATFASSVKAVRATNEGWVMSSSRSLVDAINSMIEDPVAESITKRSSTVSVDERVSRHVVIAVQHWHAHMVRSMAFIMNNNELVTCGEEGVLVFWHINEGTKRFLPRFGAPLHCVKAGKSLLCITLGDNSLKILDLPTNTIVGAYHGIRVPLSILKLDSSHPTAFSIQRKDYLPISFNRFEKERPYEMLVVGSGVSHSGLGANSVLQCYDLAGDRSLGTLSMNQQNYISRPDFTPKSHQWTVQRVAVSPDGARLATIEFRESVFRGVEGDFLSSRLPSLQQLDKHLEMSRAGDLVESTPDFSHARQFRRYRRRHQQETKKQRTGKFNELEINNCSKSPGTYDDRIFESGRLYLMKFWDITVDRENVEHTKNDLITIVQSPHMHDVTQFCAVPVGLRETGKCSDHEEFDFISSSLDSTWRVWRRDTTIDRSGNSTTNYICIHTGTFRSFPVMDLTLSNDSSLTALAHPSCVSLWGPGKGFIPATAETYIDILPIPSMEQLPEGGQLLLSWIESSYVSSESSNERIMRGESFLLVSTGKNLYLWDLTVIPSSIVWFQKLDGCPAILISNDWGLPLFVLAYPSRDTVDIYEVSRAADGTVGCRVRNSLKSDDHLPFQEKYSRYGRRLIGCCAFGHSHNPQVGCLNSVFEMKVFTIGNDLNALDGKVHKDVTVNVVVKSLESRIIEDVSDGKHDNAGEEEKRAKERKVDVTGNNKTEAYETSFLSTYLVQSSPPTMTSPYDVNKLKNIIGQSKDGPSHLVNPPSSMFREMIQAYLLCSR